jgi:TonB family protein
MGASGSARVGDTPRFGAAQTTGPETRPATAYPPGVRQAGVETPPADRAGTGIATGTRPEGRRNSPGRLLTAKAEPGPLVEPDRKAKTVDADTLAPACPISYALHNPGFTFPRRAMYLGLSGKVVVRVEVLPDGRTGRMWIKHSSGSALLDEDAKSQLSRWHFVPMSRNGRHVTAWVDVPVDYRLKEGSGY